MHYRQEWVHHKSKVLQPTTLQAQEDTICSAAKLSVTGDSCISETLPATRREHMMLAHTCKSQWMQVLTWFTKTVGANV